MDCPCVKDFKEGYPTEGNTWNRSLAVLRDKSALAWIQRKDIFDYFLSKVDTEARANKISSQSRLQCQEKWVFAGDEFFTTKVGWGFGPNMIDEIKDKINIFLQTVADDGTGTTLWKMWVNESVPCLEKRSDQSSQMDFHDFSILYYALLLTGGVLVMARFVEDWIPSLRTDRRVVSNSPAAYLTTEVTEFRNSQEAGT